VRSDNLNKIRKLYFKEDIFKLSHVSMQIASIPMLRRIQGLTLNTTENGKLAQYF